METIDYADETYAVRSVLTSLKNHNVYNIFLVKNGEMRHVRTVRGIKSKIKAIEMHLLLECYEYLKDHGEAGMPIKLKIRLEELREKILLVKRHKRYEEYLEKLERGIFDSY